MLLYIVIYYYYIEIFTWNVFGEKNFKNLM